MPEVSHLFEPLEEAIRYKFINALLKHEVNERERELVSLPAHMGGMGIYKPTEACQIASANSALISQRGRSSDPAGSE